MRHTMYHHGAALLGRTFGPGRSRLGALLVAPAPVDQGKHQNEHTGPCDYCAFARDPHTVATYRVAHGGSAGRPKDVLGK